jgi:hypothetical protein
VALWPAVCRFVGGMPGRAFLLRSNHAPQHWQPRGWQAESALWQFRFFVEEVSPRFSFVRPSRGRDANMLESLLIVLALAWTAACLAVGIWACAAGETIATVRRGSVGKPLCVLLTGLLRSDSGWQWFALGAAWTRAVPAPVPAFAPVVTQRLTALPYGLHSGPSALCGGPPAEGRFSLPRLASD